MVDFLYGDFFIDKRIHLAVLESLLESFIYIIAFLAGQSPLGGACLTFPQ